MKLPRDIEDAIADFRELPRADDYEWDAGPCGMDSLLEVIIEKYNIAKPRPERTIMENWRNIMGENAQRCAPERIDSQGRLVVAVANPVLRRELAFSRKSIVWKIRRLNGCGDISDIDFRAG
jgi:hypothetical protein